MPRDWRFWLVVALMFGAIVACAMIRATEIEHDLLVRSQRALAAAGVPYYGLEIEGRDAVLRGPVGSPREGDLVRQVVAGVRGVRDVQAALIVESFPEPGPQAAPRRPTVAPTLRMQRLGERMFVDGRLPDDAAADELRQHLDDLGGEVASFRVSVVDDVAEAAWMARLDELVSLAAGLEGTGRLTIEGSTAVLSGLVADAGARERLIRRARAIAGLSWRFDLFSRDGSAPLAGDD